MTAENGRQNIKSFGVLSQINSIQSTGLIHKQILVYSRLSRDSWNKKGSFVGVSSDIKHNDSLDIEYFAFLHSCCAAEGRLAVSNKCVCNFCLEARCLIRGHGRTTSCILLGLRSNDTLLV